MKSLEQFKCRWLRKEEQRLFTLGPVSVKGSPEVIEEFEGFKKQKGVNKESAWLLLSSFGDEVNIQRINGSSQHAGHRAVAVAESTGNPTVAAYTVGVTDDNIPVFCSAGRVDTIKADPLSPEALEGWAEQMVANIHKVSRADLATLSTEALSHLNVDYKNISVPRLERAIEGYRTTVGTPPNPMLRVQRVEISRTLQKTIKATGARAKRFPSVRANLAQGFAVNDRLASGLISQHHSFWVRDRYGNISRGMSQQARAIITRGLERGMGRDDIARALTKMTGKGLRDEAYYRTVAGVHVARARSFSLGSTFQAAGIEYFRIEAVLDDRTTHQCQFLHKKILPVGASFAHVARTIRDPNPEAVLTNQPFIKDEGDKLTVPTPGGGTKTVAEISSRSTGALSGSPASFTNGMSQAQLVDAAVGFPPYHFGCRTTLIPE